MKIAFYILTLMLLSTAIISGSSNILQQVDAVDFSSPPVLVNDEQNQKISIDSYVTDDGRIYIVWSERRGADFDIFMSVSSNNGTTFSNDTLVNNNISGNQFNPRIAVNPDGTVFVVWQGMVNDSVDIVLARSTDRGETFTNGISVNAYQTGYQQFPSLAVNGNDVVVVWEESRSDSTIRIWDPDTGALIREMVGHEEAVQCLDFSPIDNRLVSGGEDDMAKVWNSQTGALITNLTDHTNYVTAVNWTSDGSIFATGSWDYNVTLWNSTDYSVITRFYQTNNGTGDVILENPVNAIAFSPDATQTIGQIAVAYNGRFSGMPTGEPNEMFNLTVWNMSDSSSWTVNEANGGHGTPPASGVRSVMDVAFSHNGTYIASGSKDDNVMIWNATSSAKFAEVDFNMDVLSICWSPDDTKIAAGLRNGTIVVFNISNPSDRYWLKQHNGRVNDLSWNVVRNELASGASDPQAKIWDQANQTEFLNLSDHMNSVYAIDWNPSGNIIATAGGNSIQYKMGESQIFGSVSTNAGLTFPDAIQITDSNTGMRHRPKVAIDNGSNISVVWYDLRDGIEKIYYVNSTDKGLNYRTNIPVVKNLAKVQNVPDIAVESETGKAHVVWQYDQGTSVYYANSSDGFLNGIQLAASGQLPRVSTSASGSSTWVSWRDSGVKVNISYDHGASFNNLTSVNNSFVSGICISTDSHDQTSISWLTMGPFWNIYHVSSVVTDTWSPTVTGTIPTNYSENVSFSTQIQVNFSEPMDNQSVENAFSMTDGGTIITASNCTIIWNDYHDKVTFFPIINLSSDTLYTVTINQSSEDISGNYMLSDYLFSFTTLNSSISLREGWNLISLPLVQTDESIDQVLNSIVGKWDCIQAYDPLSSEPWKSTNIFRPDQLNTLSTLDHKMGFWINITQPGVNLTLSGYIPTSTSIPLYAGWNLVGYPSLTNRTIADALWGTGADKVEVFDPAEPYRIKEVGPTYLMKPGEGYWVHVPMDTFWIVDW